MSDHTTQVEAAASAASAAIAGWASKATYTGAGAFIVGWLTSSEFGVLVGLLLGIGGFLVNWYYKARQDRRDEQAHVAKMRTIQAQSEDKP